MKYFKEYSFGGGAIGSYKPVADLGDYAGKSYYGGLHANAEKKITQSDIDQIEKYADRLFASLKIDIEFTRHFMDRVNDARNIKQITVAELIRLFKQAYRRYGKRISKMPDDANAVINDMKTDINMPFVIDIGDKGAMELIAKTVMRKKNFTTSASSPKLSFESFQHKLDEVAAGDFAPVTHQMSLSELIFDSAGYGSDMSATSTVRGGPGSVANNMWMPLSSSIFDRALPKQVRATVFHVTRMSNFDQLYAIQNSRRSISTFANMDRGPIAGGVQGGSGLVVEVDGNVLAASREDLFTIPEKSGRRMMAFNWFRGPWGSNDVVKMAKGLEKLLKTLVNKYGKSFDGKAPKGKGDWEKWEYMRGAYMQAKSKGDKSAGKVMQSIVKDYMDGVEKVFKQNAKQVQDTLTNYVKRRKTDDNWDEIVVDDFNIKKVWIITDSDELNPGDAEAFKETISLTKIPVETIDSQDMEALVRYEAQLATEATKINESRKTIKVGEDAVLGDGSPHYALVSDRKVVATGTKQEMLELSDTQKGRVWLTKSNTGDIVEGIGEPNIFSQKNPRIPRKKGQPAGSDKHSDLYTDEDPEGTIHGLGFKDVETAKASVKKIEGSDRTHAHKIQAAIAMEQRAKVMGKSAEAAVYRAYIEKMKKKTKEMNEKAPDTEDAMKRHKAGKAGFTDIAHLKAKGLIKRSDGTKRKSDKYK